LFAQPADDKPEVTGEANPSLAPFDEMMTSFLDENKVPGAALAVTRNGKLVYARGFGYSDVERKEPVDPKALFRIASVSKPFTAVAIIQLVQQGKLKLDDHVVDYIKLEPYERRDKKPDPRWKQITVRNCLDHTGGWDRGQSYDPIGRTWRISRSLDIPQPVGPNELVRYMMAQPLDFDPGTRYAYSNLGYLVLSRIMEQVTGQKYEPYMKEHVLAPLGIKAMQLGRALPENRAQGEVKYYDAKNRKGRCIYPPHVGESVPLQYGGENIEGYEAHGGWIATAPELVKFASSFDDASKCPLLSAASIDKMWSRPAGAPGHRRDGQPKSRYYACGWDVHREGDSKQCSAWHAGFITGSESLMVRRADGLCWAVLFNTATNPQGKSLSSLIDSKIHEAAGKVKSWPSTDLFRELLS
jgi:N-acyl-D-amino-acid deacylase